MLQNLPIGEAGTYAMTVTGLGETTGQFIGRLLLNANVEFETHGGDSNDSMATAQDIEPAMLPLGAGSAERAAVVGYLGGNTFPGEYWRDFEVNVAAGDVLDVATSTPIVGPKASSVRAGSKAFAPSWACSAWRTASPCSRGSGGFPQDSVDKFFP